MESAIVKKHVKEKLKHKSQSRLKINSVIKEIRNNVTSYVMIAPFALLFIVFVFVPVIASIILSFTYFNMLQIPKWIGFENYARLFLSDDVFIIAVQKTLLFAIITGPIGYILSFIFAWFINELGRKLRAFMTLILYAPSLAGNVYFIWTFIFSGDAFGLVNSTLMKIGILKDPIQWLTDSKYSFKVVLIVIIWLSLGAGFLAFIAGLKTIDKTYYEAAAIDGVRNRWQELWYVTLPQMVPQLLFGAVMSISSSFAVGYQSMALTGFPSSNYAAHTILLHMLDYGTIRFEMGYASAIAVVLFSLMLFTWWLINNLLSKLSS
jgi:multiple sugar transport system permease protein